MFMKKVQLYIVSISVILLFTMCSQKVKSDSNPDSVDITINRFDKEFKAFLDNPSTEKEDSLQIAYKDFLPAFGLVTIGKSEIDTTYFDSLSKYFSNKMLLSIYADAVSIFSDATVYEKELTNADAIIKKNSDGKKLPAIGFHVSGFKENTLVLDNYISISIDKYLGKEYPIYAHFFEEYQREQMQPKMVTRDLLRAWLISNTPIKKDKTQNLLSEMIAEGIILYQLSVLLLEWNSYDIIGYTEQQEKWCSDNEKRIWTEMIKQNYLFSTDITLTKKFVIDAPYTQPLSKESPGRAGAWIGWQIVKRYMKDANAPLFSLNEIDEGQILQESKYNP